MHDFGDGGNLLNNTDKQNEWNKSQLIKNT